MNMARGAIEQADVQFGFEVATCCEPAALCASSRGAREAAEGCDVQERLDFPDGDVQGIS
jgi:hypothetical protein